MSVIAAAAAVVAKAQLMPWIRRTISNANAAHPPVEIHRHRKQRQPSEEKRPAAILIEQPTREWANEDRGKSKDTCRQSDLRIQAAQLLDE